MKYFLIIYILFSATVELIAQTNWTFQISTAINIKIGFKNWITYPVIAAVL